MYVTYTCAHAHARATQSHAETESHANASPSLCLPDPHPFPLLLVDESLYCHAPPFSVTWQSLEQEAAVLHRAHTSGFCSALEQLSHSVSLLLSLSAAASSVLGIWCLKHTLEL